jgi:hypothetical protein
MRDALKTTTGTSERETEMSDISLPTEKPKTENLVERQEREEQALCSAYIFMWTPIPAREKVRVILDEGLIKMMLHRDKFLALLQNVMDIDHSPTNYHYFQIKESCYRYSGWYLYDKEVDQFIELGEKAAFERIRPIDLLTEARSELLQKKFTEDQRNMREIQEASKDVWKFKTGVQPSSITQRPNMFHQTIRGFSKKLKRPKN